MTTLEIKEVTSIAFQLKTETVLQYKPYHSQTWTTMPDLLENEIKDPGQIVARLYNFHGKTAGFEFDGLTEPAGSTEIRRQFLVGRERVIQLSCDATVTLQPRPTSSNGKLVHVQLGDGRQTFKIVSASGTFAAYLDDSTDPKTSIPANTSASKLVLKEYDPSTEIEIQMDATTQSERLAYDKSIVLCNDSDHTQYVGFKTSAEDHKVRLWIDPDASAKSLAFGLPLPSEHEGPLELTFVIYDTDGNLIHGDPTFKTFNVNSTITT